jgi:predicted unusual protein kinase regulating ubiquinone biosynthesis (AarF/ABC1/UbiB family)
VRDRLATLLLELLMRELFEFRLMQTDPNFANYRFNAVDNRLVLLDFGATQEIREQTMLDYRTIMRAVLTGDEAAGVQAATDIGFIASGMKPHHQKAVLEMTKVAMEPLQKDEPFDFSNTQITQRLSDMGMEFAADREVWHLPPVDTLFIQRKFSGVYLLASRLKAKVNVRAIIAKYLV